MNVNIEKKITAAIKEMGYKGKTLAMRKHYKGLKLNYVVFQQKTYIFIIVEKQQKVKRKMQDNRHCTELVRGINVRTITIIKMRDET